MRFLCTVVLRFLFVVNIFETGSGQNSTHVKHLMTTLFTTRQYNTEIRPKINQTQPTDIFINFFLNGITGFNEIEQKLTTTAFLEITWTDEFLQWDDALYGGLLDFSISQGKVWLPAIALHNGFTNLKGLGSTFIRVNVDNLGTVEWKPFHVFESKCKLDSTYFPYEKEVCNIDFIAWGSNTNDIQLVVGDIGVFVDGESSNGQWSMVGSRAIAFSEDDKSWIRFMLTIQRKPLFYVINVILPIIFLSILNLFTFLIPADIGERMGYSITVWLAFTVFLTIVSTSLPQSVDKWPIISIFVLIQLILGTLTVLVSTVQTRIVHFDDKKTQVYKFLEKLVVLKRKSLKVGRKKNAIHVTKKDIISENENETDKETSLMKIEENVTWRHVTSAIDFFCFWIFFVTLFIVTLIIIVAANKGGDNSVSEEDYNIE